MAIFILPEDAILLILQQLDSKDRIAFASTCTRFKQICLNGGAIRKVDLSRCAVRRQRCTIIKCLQDREMGQNIRELNLNNQHLIDWELDINLSHFLITFCPQLEALHVLHCGMGLKTLHCILRHAFKLKALSWSLTDIKEWDIEFLVQDMQSPSGICLENIIYLHLEIAELKSQIQMLQYLVLSRCKHLEELEIYIWNPSYLYTKKLLFKLERSWNRLYFRQPSTSIDTGTLKCLHSLTMIAISIGLSLCSYQCHGLRSQISHFVSSVVRKKSHETKWKKFCLLVPFIHIQDIFHQLSSAIPLSKEDQDELHSVETFAIHGYGSWNSVVDTEGLLQKINNNTVKSLHVCVNPSYLIHQPRLSSQLCSHIFRIGGDTLKFLSLSLSPSPAFINGHPHLSFSTLFSSCSNITDLDLLGFHFEENICKALSKLKKVVRIQFHQCAVFPNYRENPPNVANADALTFVENCQNITELHVCHCDFHHNNSCYIYDGDLVALAELTNLKSLTLNITTYVGEMTFFKKLLEHCKFLTRLRVKLLRFSCMSYFPILESAKWLKHLAIHVSSMDMASEKFWKLLSCATSLETLCIKSSFKGSLYVPGAIEMLRSLPQLYVLHLHYFSVQNFEMLYRQIMETLAEEKSDRVSCFELLCEEVCREEQWTNNKVLPINILEMCNMVPLLKLKKF